VPAACRRDKRPRRQISVGKGRKAHSKRVAGRWPGHFGMMLVVLYFLAGCPFAGAFSAAFGSGTGLSAKVCK